MRHQLSATVGSLLLDVLLVAGLLPSFGFARIDNYDNDPDLETAMQYDLEFNPGNYDKADRSIAEEHYLAYLQRCKESFQRARVYHQLGLLYSTALNLKRNERREDARAIAYFKMVLVEEPERVGRPTVIARKRLGTYAATSEDIIRGRMDVYQWTLGWNADKVRELWLPTRPNAAPPAQEDVDVVLDMIVGGGHTEAMNMVSAASHSPMAEILLGEMITRFPGTEVEKMARKALQERSKETSAAVLAGLEKREAEDVLSTDDVPDESVTPAAPEPPAPRNESPAAPPPDWRRTAAPIAAAAVLVIAGAVGLAVSRRRRRP